MTRECYHVIIKRPASARGNAGTTQNMDWVNYARLEQIFLSPDSSVSGITFRVNWTKKDSRSFLLGLADIFS